MYFPSRDENGVSSRSPSLFLFAPLPLPLPSSREHILKTAKALVEDTKLLVSGAGASQERLAQAAQSSVGTITRLADVVKLGAASLGSEDPETQVGTTPPHHHSLPSVLKS